MRRLEMLEDARKLAQRFYKDLEVELKALQEKHKRPSGYDGSTLTVLRSDFWEEIEVLKKRLR